MKCYRKNGSDQTPQSPDEVRLPSMKCYRKNGSDPSDRSPASVVLMPSMKCYRKNGSDANSAAFTGAPSTLNEVLPKER